MKTALERCPKCGSTANSRALGGNDRCFHCECGYVECADAIVGDGKVIYRRGNITYGLG